jgi:hypothetical protein
LVYVMTFTEEINHLNATLQGDVAGKPNLDNVKE